MLKEKEWGYVIPLDLKKEYGSKATRKNKSKK